MYKLVNILLLLFYFGLMPAQHTTPLWKKNAIPNFQKSKGKETIPPRDIIFIKNIQQPGIEAFLPSKQSANGMAVLICPGGGYSGVSYDWEGTDVAKWLNSKGIAAFVLKYRMPQAESVLTSYKAPIQDAQRAIRYIRYHAQEFNLDKNKIGVIGFSAGGHLASTLGTHYKKAYYNAKDDIDKEKIRPDFMMLIYPVISMKKGITHYGSRKNLLGETPSEELITAFSNELQVTENTPPTFILHAGDDPAVPIENSIKMYQALVKNKVKTTMHIYPTGGHGFGLGISRKDAPDWANLATTWLNTLNNHLLESK
ncbi:alpha/beta hydrolase [Saccharicrinis fermentans]|uniref:Acetyl esterase n=1 Tax=Saccharicrinis fermentans DSM 9555 = JCM 21142 TaxID=869213 RepID=W7YSI9_9BACT|nr:alpha/beta hydrolase [Saccharicrinis fermentans]GAF05429.1 acetyl esterase [Saccharicrinis fermentans DSM 9555 = JCM 21142]